MRALSKPSDAPGDVFVLCISKVRNRDLKSRLTAVQSAIVRAADDYDRAAASSQLHHFPRSTSVENQVTKDEMIAVYEGRMVPRTQPGRPVYERLLSLAPNRRCPRCSVGSVATLDHHLPKTEYPVLSVVPWNLIPSCDRCQRSKREAYPQDAEDQPLHPYYDDVSGERWLRATAVEGTPASFIFDVEPPQAWDHTLIERLRHHLQLFDLRVLYASNAADEILNKRQRLESLLNTGGAESVHAYLVEERDSFEAASLNSWQAAMYRAASDSEWFCQGGFGRTSRSHE
jgi:hypothetical protein